VEKVKNHKWSQFYLPRRKANTLNQTAEAKQLRGTANTRATTITAGRNGKKLASLLGRLSARDASCLLRVFFFSQ
jgi:hypothetical protein